jgi:hypothetical protein
VFGGLSIELSCKICRPSQEQWSPVCRFDLDSLPAEPVFQAEDPHGVLQALSQKRLVVVVIGAEETAAAASR